MKKFFLAAVIAAFAFPAAAKSPVLECKFSPKGTRGWFPEYVYLFQGDDGSDVIVPGIGLFPRLSNTSKKAGHQVYSKRVQLRASNQKLYKVAYKLQINDAAGDNDWFTAKVSSHQTERDRGNCKTVAEMTRQQFAGWVVKRLEKVYGL